MSGFMTYFGGDSTGFMRTVKAMEGAVSKLGSKMSADMKSAIGGFVGYQAFKTLVANVVAATSAIHSFAKQQNISYEAAQRLGKSAKESGQSMEDYGTILNKLAGSREAAAVSDDKMLSAFSKFGVTMDELQNPLTTNYDLIVKIGKALNGMKIDAGTQASFRELFGRGGAAMINSIKVLGQEKPLTLISDADVEKIREMERSVERMKSNWNKRAAGPIGQFARYGAGAIEMMAGDDFEKVTKMQNMFNAYAKAYPDEAESTMEALNSALDVFGGSEMADPAIQEAIGQLLYNSVAKHGKEASEKMFPGMVGSILTGKEEVANAQKNRAAQEKLFISEREKPLIEEELRLHEMIRKSEIDKLQPAQRAIELRRQANIELLRSEELNSTGSTIADKIEAVKAREKALQLNDQAYGIENNGGGGGSRPDKMAIDEMAKNNLSVGIKAYEPMMNATTVNTTATISNTDALNKNGAMITSLLSTVTISAWD